MDKYQLSDLIITLKNGANTLETVEKDIIHCADNIAGDEWDNVTAISDDIRMILDGMRDYARELRLKLYDLRYVE